MSSYTERLVQLVRELGVIQIGRFKLSSGDYSEWKFEADVGFANEEFSEIVGRAAAEKFYTIEIETMSKCAVATVDTGGTVLLQKSLPYINDVDYVVIKKKEEDSEVVGQIEKRPYVIFEDVISKGLSVKRVADIVRRDGGKPVGAVGLYEREETGVEFLKNDGLKVEVILHKNDIINQIKGVSP